MRPKGHKLLISVVWLALGGSTLAQGNLVDPSFEEPRNLPSPGQMMSPADALPGWDSYVGTNRASWSWFNNISLDSAAAGIQNSNSPYQPAGLRIGDYCLSLQPGVVLTSPYTFYFGRASIAQTVQIPADAKSIRFRATYPFPVTFAGAEIPMVVSTPRPAYSFFAGDISPFAGQVGELRIFSSPLLSFALNDVNYLDGIAFSSYPVPEPGAFCLGGVGVCLFLISRAWSSSGSTSSVRAIPTKSETQLPRHRHSREATHAAF